MNVEGAGVQPQCPRCGGPLVQLDDRALLAELNGVRRHAYRCPSGCPGPEPDGTFAVIACPACGSHDTSSRPIAEAVEEVECSACGAITSLQFP